VACHALSLKVNIIEKQSKQCQQGGVEIGTALITGGNVKEHSNCGNGLVVPQKIKIELSCDLPIPLLHM
jgi:hypothetical protein